MNSFDATMATLRARFVVRAVEDLDTLRAHRAGLLLSAQDFRALVHRLAGSAGLFGFDEISTLAGQVDDQLAGGRYAATLPELVTALEAVVLECRANS